METQKKQRKATERKKVPFVVEVGETMGPGWKPAALGADGEDAPHETTADAAKWIKENGVAGKTYRVTHVTFGPVTVKMQTVEKRTLE